MEKKKVIIELEVLTARPTDRETERDIDRLVIPLLNLGIGETTVTGVDVKEIR